MLSIAFFVEVSLSLDLTEDIKADELISREHRSPNPPNLIRTITFLQKFSLERVTLSIV